MRLLFVAQRYGDGVFGGAEQLTRELATRLAPRGHDVHVLTTCALSYVDWADYFAPGTAVDNGVTVHRLPVDRPREDRLFAPLNARVSTREMSALVLQRDWMTMQGPSVSLLPAWLEEHGGSFDVIIFMTYLYNTTWSGLPVASRIAPTVLHPTAHDEPQIYLPIFSLMFRLPSALVFLTEEEAALVHRRFRAHQRSLISGMGIDPAPIGDSAGFRRSSGVDDDPYLVYVGRLDPHKGSIELFDFFTTYKRRNPGPLRLVLVGEPVAPLPAHPDVISTGFVDEATKHAAMSGAVALVHPSYFESFSIVLAEAWSHGKPALVQGYCDVLVGQARRSGGAIPYRGFGEFEAALDALLGDQRLADRLGLAGKRYVAEKYSWPDVLARYERFLSSLIRSRAPHAATPPREREPDRASSGG